MKIEDVAVVKLKEILKDSGKSGFLRVFMSQGCCGPSVAMDLVEKPVKDDLEISKDGFKVYLDKEAGTLLENAVLDCDKAGGIIIKGMAKSSGGCGDDCGDGCGCGDGGCGH